MYKINTHFTTVLVCLWHVTLWARCGYVAFLACGNNYVIFSISCMVKKQVHIIYIYIYIYIIVICINIDILANCTFFNQTLYIRCHNVMP